MRERAVLSYAATTPARFRCRPPPWCSPQSWSLLAKPCALQKLDPRIYTSFKLSLSAAFWPSRFCLRHPIINTILVRLTYILFRPEKTVQFCWIAGHVCAAGDELADAAARRAASAPCSRRRPFPTRDFCLAVRAPAVTLRETHKQPVLG